jgi:hypothetical protein
MNPTSALVEQIRSGTAPQNIREFAAQGLLPIPEDDLIGLQVVLCKDRDQNIIRMAKESLSHVQERTWIRIIERKNPDLAVVDFCLDQQSFPSSIKERILLNHSVPDSTVSRIAATESGPLLDLIINNQVRLLRAPEILKALESNHLLTLDQKRRIEEFKTEFVFKKRYGDVPPEVAEVVSLTFEDILAKIPDLDTETQKIILEVDSKPKEEVTEEQVEQVLHSIFSDDELQQIPEETLTTYQRILKMAPGDKVRMALFGNRDERSILIRDGNRIVASMVLKNPKLTDPEMENYSMMRNLDSELLRQMGRSREFLKRYVVIHNLVKNPKTPSPVSLNLLKLLREMDLRNLSRDKNIPDVIRRQAQRLHEAKEKHH